jgi:hypothetical protein
LQIRKKLEIQKSTLDLDDLDNRILESRVINPSVHPNSHASVSTSPYNNINIDEDFSKKKPEVLIVDQTIGSRGEDKY